MNRKLSIDRELRSLLPPMDKEQRDRLKRLIEAEGCHDAIKVWKGKNIIVDGHHRYEICNELGCEFAVQELHFEDKAEVAEWMVSFQEGRRNMTPAAIATARGLAYNLRKKQHGGGRAGSSCQVDNLNSDASRTASTVASETGVSQSTVIRDGKFQEALSKLASGVREAILAGEIRKPTQKALERLNEYDAASQRVILDSVKSGSFTTLSDAMDAEEKPKKKPPKGKPQQSAAQFCDQIAKQHIGPLARDLLKLAKMTGGQDAHYENASGHLDEILQYVKGKRK